jgi:hypothetical protein
VNPTSEQALVPPRPNLGPEPWTGEGGLANLILPMTGVAVVLVAAWLWARRRGRKERLAPSPPSREAADESPEARLLALCERLRAT